MRRRILASAVAATLMACIASGARALDMAFLPETPGDEISILLLSGPIQRRDPERFRAMVRSRPGREVVVLIDSPGGNLVGAAEIADMVARWRMTVGVPPYGLCASACFLILAAATERIASDTARIGVHSVHIAGEETSGTLAMTTALARELARFGVPDAIIGRTVRTRPGDMAWLSAAELRSMGVVSLEATAPAVSPRPRAPSPAPPTAMVPPPPARTPGAEPPAPRQAAPAPRRDDAEGENTPARLVAHEPQAFRDGLRDRDAYEAWFGRLEGPRRDGALFWARNRSLPRPPPCPADDPAFLEACQEAQRRLTPSDQRRREDPEYRRGWNSFLQPAYRREVLDAMTACVREGGRPVRRQGFETALDLNGDGEADYVIDYRSFACEASQGAGMPFCGTSGCTIGVFLSTPSGHQRVFFENAREWRVIAGSRPALRLVKSGIACGRFGSDDCIEQLTFSGVAVERRRW